MPWPRLNGYGLNENPIIDSPYVENLNFKTMNPPPSGFFLLLDGSNFLLLDGTNFLLL